MRTADSAIPFLPTMQYNASDLLLLVFLRPLFVSFSLKEKALRCRRGIFCSHSCFSYQNKTLDPKQLRRHRQVKSADATSRRVETGANWNYLYFLIQVYFSPTFRATRVKNPLGDGRAISPFMPLRNDNWHCQSQNTPFPSRKKNAHKQGALISRPKHPCTLRWGASPRTAMYKLLLGAGATITEDGEKIHRKKDRW